MNDCRNNFENVADCVSNHLWSCVRGPCITIFDWTPGFRTDFGEFRRTIFNLITLGYPDGLNALFDEKAVNEFTRLLENLACSNLTTKSKSFEVLNLIRALLGLIILP